MRILIFLFLAFTAGAQDIKKVEGVLDTDIKSVSGILAEDVARVNGVTLASFTGLLDSYSGAGVAYSVRKLDKDYAGYCMRIKRLSDNSTLDVGFDSNGDLDESAITTFCAGSVDATVTIWYDQSGNGYDLIPNADNNTLLICDNGVVLEKNGKPAINTDSDDFLVSVDISDIVGSNAIYVLGTFTYKENSSLGTILIYSFDFTLYPVGIGYLLNGEDFAMGGADQANSYVEGTFNGVDGTQYIIEYGITSSSNGFIYVDGTDVETHDETYDFTPSPAFEDLYVGGASASYPGESIQEIIIWPLNQSSNRASIYANVAAYF